MNRLKELRKQKGLTQQGLADEISVSKITVLRWENEERQIKPEKAQQLADYFGVSVGYLLGFTDSKKVYDDEKVNIDYDGRIWVYSLLNFPYLNDLLWYCFRWQALTKIRKELTNGIGLYGRQERAVYH